MILHMEISGLLGLLGLGNSDMIGEDDSADADATALLSRFPFLSPTVTFDPFVLRVASHLFHFHPPFAYILFFVLLSCFIHVSMFHHFGGLHPWTKVPRIALLHTFVRRTQLRAQGRKDMCSMVEKNMKSSSSGKKKQRTRALSAPTKPHRSLEAAAKSLDAALKGTAWGADSMASSRCSGNKNLLYNLRRCSPVPVTVADGAVVTAMYVGSTDLYLKVAGSDRTVHIQIDGVYYHERFDANLLSAQTLVAEGWELHCSKDETYILTPEKDKVVASTLGRLTVLHCAEPERVRRSYRS